MRTLLQVTGLSAFADSANAAHADSTIKHVVQVAQEIAPGTPFAHYLVIGAPVLIATLHLIEFLIKRFKK